MSTGNMKNRSDQIPSVTSEESATWIPSRSTPRRLPKARKKKPEHLTIYIDGVGSRIDGIGSSCAFLISGSSQRYIKRVEGWTYNQGVYNAFRHVLKNLPVRATARIFLDSRLVVNEFNGKWAVHDTAMRWQLDRVRKIISDRGLQISLFLISREQRLARKLL
jgi:ribonuclease HI